ncbi:AAA family ATPase [Microbacterium murale]|uniref:Adenylate kinase n=1 Tax=Microbacterium murale TaxID=1081040 RepID=A0ABQ1RYR8_9MICO|nr:AAA family ATPase [Microbacterium murale]GGD84344.1 adenylate kinase [Microbacterium murale]
MLSADDPLPFRPERVLVAGVTGSGKTTLARRIAARWDLTHQELDALYHGPGWTPRPEFVDDVRAFAATDRWVTEWQYTSKGTNTVLPRSADLLVWIDYPYGVARRRLIRRTWKRRILRTKLWNGNVEPNLWHALTVRSDENILDWQRRTRHKWSERMPQIEAEHPHLTIVRLTHPRETERWLAHQRGVERAKRDETG